MIKYLFLILLLSPGASAQTYIQGNNLIEVPVTTATAGSTTTFTNATKKNQQFTGVTTQTIVLPNATTLQNGRTFYITNRSTGTLTIEFNDTTTALTLLAGNQAYFIVESNATSNGSWDIGGTQTPLTIGNLTDAGTDGITVTNGAGSVIGTGTSFAQHVADTTHNGYLASADWNTFNGKQAALTFMAPLVNTTNTITCNVASGSQPGCLASADWTTFNNKQAAGSYITALTGDVTASGPGSATATLASVATAGTTGSSTAIPVVTINAKGLTTGITTAAVVAPAGTLSGTTLNSTVVSSSLTSVGTIATGVWNGTTIAIANGGTGQASANAAFNALSPMTTGGDLIYGGASGAATRLANGSSGQVLTSGGGTAAPTWASAPAPSGVFGRNFLINSGFDLWQRGTSFTNTGGLSVQTKTADRWVTAGSGTGTNSVTTITQTTGANLGSVFGMQVKITTAPGSPAAAGMYTGQYAENLVTQQYLYNQTVSGSALIKSLGNITKVALYISYNTSQTSSINSAVNTKEVDCTVNSSTWTLCSFSGAAVGTGPTTSGVVGLVFVADAASTGNVTDLNNGYIVEQAMLNQGPTPATYARAGANAGEELAMAQRYLEALWGGFYGAANNATTCEVAVTYKVQKVQAPTLTTSTAVWVREAGGDKQSSSPASLANIGCTTVSCWFQITNFTGLTAGDMCFDRGASNATPWGIIDAEF